jgi:hypothetical protein
MALATPIARYLVLETVIASLLATAALDGLG